MHTSSILCLTLFVVSATAFQCCFPDQYQGVFRKAYTKHLGNKVTYHSEAGTIYTDFTGNREYLDLTSYTEPHKKFQVLSDYGSGFFYFSAYGECLFKIAMPSTTMRDRCEYCTKTFPIGQDYYGSNANSLDVQILKGQNVVSMSTNFPVSQRNFITSVFKVDSTHVLPVFERGSFVAMDTSTNYYNTDHAHFQTSISDTSVFDVPSGCDTNQVGLKEFDKILKKKFKETQSSSSEE